MTEKYMPQHTKDKDGDPVIVFNCASTDVPEIRTGDLLLVDVPIQQFEMGNVVVIGMLEKIDGNWSTLISLNEPRLEALIEVLTTKLAELKAANNQ